jgi:phosphatidylglycerophosphate synthase
VQAPSVAPPATDATSVVEAPDRRSRIRRDLTTVPNLLSISRLLAVMAGFALYLYGHPLVALGLGLWAGISDYLDGIIARRTGQVTEMGAAIDRLGDLVGESFGFILVIHLGALSPLYFAIYLLREAVVVSARQYVAEHKERGIAIRSSIFGKLKSNALLYSLLLILALRADVIAPGDLRDAGLVLGEVGIGLGLVFSYVSGALYLRTFARSYNAG